MNLIEEIKKGESKTLELKEILPGNDNIARTIIAFSNTSGGKLVIGVNNKREIIGLKDTDIFELQDKISSIVYDSVYPNILPEIYTTNINNKIVLVVEIFRGNLLPYYLKKEGKNNGTYIRIGATNRKAAFDNILELERQRRNISFDEEINYEHDFYSLDLSPIKAKFEKINKTLDDVIFLAKTTRNYGEKLIDPKARQKEIEKLKKKLLKIKKAEEIIDIKQSEAKNKEEKERIKNRTSNTTDPDANLMKMKDGSYKMANVQLATSNQIILSYDVNSDANDKNSLPKMIDKTENITNHKVEEIKADSGYFTKDGIKYCNGKEINAYIPDPLKSKEEKEERENRIPKYDRKNFKYDSEKDEFICPEGKKLVFRKHDKGCTKYIGTACPGCPVKNECTKSKYRNLTIDPELEEFITEMRAKLNSDEGKRKYMERFSDVEPVFGNLKLNQGFNYFLCRGKPMVLIELGLQSISHNFVKIFNWLKRTKKSISDCITMYGKEIKPATTQ